MVRKSPWRKRVTAILANGDNVKGVFRKILDNSAMLALVSLMLGAVVMVGMFLVFENAFDDPRPEPEVVSAFVEGSEELAEGEIFQIPIRSIPAPFISPEDGSVLGYVFLDVTMEVAGEDAKERAEDSLAVLITEFTELLAEDGVGMSARPGVVDYDRLARVFMELAQVQVGQSGVARVVVQASGAG